MTIGNNESLRQKRQRAGQLGGITTLLRHGNGYFSEISVYHGGRKRKPTLAELQKQRQKPTVEPKIVINGGKLPATLNGMKRLWMQIKAERDLINPASQGGR
jgi:hypothetical protein